MVADDNPFIRFKNCIDRNVRRGADVLFGSSVSPSPSATTSGSGSSTPSNPGSSNTPNTPVGSTLSPPSTSSPPAASSLSLSTSSSSSSSPPSSPSPSPPEQRRQGPPSSQLLSPPSLQAYKMADTSSSSSVMTASNAGESEQHTTALTGPITPPNTAATPASTMDDVQDWAIHSPYSPLNLQQLPQPTPRDVPRAWDADAHFTFRDAFEDLLVAGSGRPLPSGHDLAWRKAREGFFSPFSSPPSSALGGPFLRRERERGLHVTQWVDSLGLLGLWDAYFRLEPAARRRIIVGGGGGGETTHPSHPRMYFRDRLTEPRRRRWEDRRGFVGSSSFDGSGLWELAWRAGVDRDAARWDRWRGARDPWDDDNDGDGIDVNANADADADGADADIEDELYNKPSGHGDAAENRIVKRAATTTGAPPAAPEVTTTVYADGSRLVRTTERREKPGSGGGKTEATTTERHFDPDGNLVAESRQSSTTRTWSGRVPGAEASFSWSWNNNNRSSSSVDSEHNSSSGEAGEEGRDRKNGWFWRR
ncbi:hypothetical protein SAMD00023353_10000230 [Rosellinia necatrix]|uniref:Uncharacterized protein n=1 Tax=Rosellinia necatrix TaxID=77044 RepID=A0A1W2TWL5_ROSNE|nr:hypothetical protein SAMD00023353_10000230 [Rosellinia necatrix]